MDRKWIGVAVVALALCAPAKAVDAPAAKADQSAPAASTKEQLDKMDQGPDTIDISAYPKEQQENYPIFAGKCSRCHTLARPINSPYALPEEWESYVTKMSQKPRSGIDKASAKKIIDFLTYDSSVRKKELIEKKVKAKPPEKKGEAKPKTAD